MPLSGKDRANGKKVNTWRGSIRYINRDDIFFSSTYGTFTKIYQWLITKKNLYKMEII